MSKRLRLLVPLVAGFLVLVVTPSEAASVRVLDAAAPGRPVEVHALGLQPGEQVSVALLPSRSRSDMGVVIPGPHSVPADGRLRVMFRWPTKYHVCPPRLRGGCTARRW